VVHDRNIANRAQGCPWPVRAAERDLGFPIPWRSGPELGRRATTGAALLAQCKSDLRWLLRKWMR
jgi:hypothetical protein